MREDELAAGCVTIVKFFERRNGGSRQTGLACGMMTSQNFAINLAINGLFSVQRPEGFDPLRVAIAWTSSDSC